MREHARLELAIASDTSQPASPASEAGTRRAVFAIAFGAGFASLSMNFWIPFVPLYLKELGAGSDANALFWAGIAAGSQGVARLVTGPVWGILSDRYGRRPMFLRALYSASITMAVAAFATEPWHIAAAFAMQGLFSGFIPAATALISVTVPDRRLNSSLSMVTGAQFIGNTLGPAIGGVLAYFVGYRGAIIGGAALPLIAGVFAQMAVPRDLVAQADTAGGEKPKAGGGSIRALLTGQFTLALLIWFVALSFGQLVRTAAPISLEQLVGPDKAASAAAIGFTVAGLGGVIGVVVSGRLIRPGLLRTSLVITAICVGLAHLLLPLANGIVTFTIGFAVIAMLSAAMVPATNTLIAANAPRERRGTAFGLAGGIQAFAFMVGPMTAAGFAVVSLHLGFIAVGVVFFLLALVIWTGVREPDLDRS